MKPLRSPGLRLALLLVLAYLVAWVLFMGLARDARAGGLPLITWSQIALSAAAVGLSLAAVPLLEKWERRE